VSWKPHIDNRRWVKLPLMRRYLKHGARCFSYVQYILVGAIAVAWLCGFTVLQVSSESMRPTLNPDDRLLVARFDSVHGTSVIPRFGPRRRQIVTFRSVEDKSVMFVKRVLGLSGDRIQISRGVLFVNNVPQVEPYAILMRDEKWPLSVGPDRRAVTVPPGYYFLLGDNRPSSRDSRSFGMIAASDLTGVVIGAWSDWRPWGIRLLAMWRW